MQLDASSSRSHASASASASPSPPGSPRNVDRSHPLQQLPPAPPPQSWATSAFFRLSARPNASTFRFATPHHTTYALTKPQPPAVRVRAWEEMEHADASLGRVSARRTRRKRVRVEDDGEGEAPRRRMVDAFMSEQWKGVMQSCMPICVPSHVLEPLLPSDLPPPSPLSHQPRPKSHHPPSRKRQNALATVKFHSHPAYLLHSPSAASLHDLHLSLPTLTPAGLRLQHRTTRPTALTDCHLQQRIVNITPPPENLEEPISPLLLATPSAVFLSSCTPDAVTVANPVPIPAVWSSTINPFVPEHVSLLTADALYSGPVSRYVQSYQSLTRDVQPLHHHYRYKTLCNGVHPQTLLLCNRGGLSRFDLRTPHVEPLFDIQQTWNQPAYTSCSTFTHLSSFSYLLQTSTTLFLVDTRRPIAPVLDYAFPHVTNADILLRESLPNDQFLIAVASTAYDDVSLLHLQATGVASGALPGATGVIGDGTDAFDRGWQWGDDAVGTGNNSSDTAGCTVPLGMALMCINAGNSGNDRNGSGSVVVVRQSPAVGTVADVVDFETDGEERWEYAEGGASFSAELFPDSQAMPELKHEGPWGGENVIRLNNFLNSHADWLGYEHAKPVTHSVPGGVWMGHTRIMFRKDAMEILLRIIGGDSDESDPRPKMEDLVDEWEVEADGKELQSMFEDSIAGFGIDEIMRVVRAGQCHQGGVGVGKVEAMLAESDVVKWDDVEWHAGCGRSHKELGGVSTDEKLPAWCKRRVYWKKEVRVGEEMEGMKKGSEFGKLMGRMKHMFFDGREEGTAT